MNLSNLQQGHQKGCQLCYKERNGLPEYLDDIDRRLHGRVKSIKLRCYNAGTNGFATYGAEGVTVYGPWFADEMTFVRYLRNLPGFSLDKTIDRIDNSKGYEPGNLRWASLKEQAFNRRTTIQVEHNNETMSFSAFVKNFTDFSLSQAYALRKNGMSLEQLANTKPKLIGARVRFEKLRKKT